MVSCLSTAMPRSYSVKNIDFLVSYIFGIYKSMYAPIFFFFPKKSCYSAIVLVKIGRK